MPARSAPWLFIVLATLLGLALRIAAARGDYWLDEAWSALFARDAGTPGRVFFAINHDNNHYLNTLWLQLVGWGAAPLLGRALSIACGTAGIAVAGLIGARRGPLAAGITALLFAVSPILVTYGSEARGYAPMLLALLVAIWIVDREISGTGIRRAPIWLGLATLLGMLGHVSMLFGVGALILWVAIDRKRRLPWRGAAIATGRLMGRAIVAMMAVLLLVILVAALSPTGLRVGSLAGFSWRNYCDALAYMIAFTLGWPFAVGLWLGALLLLPLLARPVLRWREGLPFLLIAILGLPLAVALIGPENSAFPRYYLLSAVAMLLLVADLMAASASRRSWPGAVVLIAMLCGSLMLDGRLIAGLRGDPGAAIAAMAARAPSGASVMAWDSRDGTVLEAAAAHHGYALRIAEGCGPTRFLFAERPVAVPIAMRCGAHFRLIAESESTGLSGMDWQLYERLQ